ncbi:unnamed protein product [Cyprideis torosa]|uniref:Uncharacterized protein n=1 Tax=Cyprideis torosa TaxID=163714 RepID=A0A7R8WJH5_9CRUS|nr:unnamed protein product [Cyprideis torosa]CAG0900174.1 unnamed protein product [Cyprideis torosa]
MASESKGMDIEAEWIVDPIPNSTKCSISFDLMFDALMLPSCGHTFCGPCARGCLESQGKCPLCQRPSSASALVPNHALRHVVGELRARCPEEGCGEVVEVQNLGLHRRNCISKTTACPKGCGREMLNREKGGHDCVEFLTEQCEALRQENQRLRDQLGQRDEALATALRRDQENAALRGQLRSLQQALREQNERFTNEMKRQHGVVQDQLEKFTMDMKQQYERMANEMDQRFQHLMDPLPTPSLGGAPSPAPLAAGTSGAAAFEGLPGMTFLLRKSDYEGGEAKSNVVEAGGLKWKVSVWESGWTRFLLHAEGGRGAPSPWTLTVQSLTVKVLRKGGEGGAPLTLRLEGATFSSEKGVVGMVTALTWGYLTQPSTGFVDPQGTLHLEVSFEGPSMSPSPPPQRLTVWEAEATLQLREFTSSLREDFDSIFSPSIHVGGKEWRVRVVRSSGDYYFRLQCNPEERSEWFLRADWTISLLSAEGGGRNEEEKGDGNEVSRGDPRTFGLLIPDDSIGRFLTGDSASAVNSANGPPDLKLNMAPLPAESPGPISAPFIALSTAPQRSRFYVVQIYGFQSGMPRTTPAR